MAAMTNAVTFVAGLLFGGATWFVIIRPILVRLFEGEWRW